MKTILVINGPNINMLGIREPGIYGSNSYEDLVNYIYKQAEAREIKAEVFQSNYEGEIVTLIQNSLGKYDGIIINAGGYTHTSIAILDALKAVDLPVVEVHLSDISQREGFRKNSYISLVAKKIIIGKGFKGYLEALEYFFLNWVNGLYLIPNKSDYYYLFYRFLLPWCVYITYISFRKVYYINMCQYIFEV